MVQLNTIFGSIMFLCHHVVLTSYIYQLVLCKINLIMFVCHMYYLQAAHYLCNRGLLNLSCQAVANMIKGKSPHEICKIFNIESYVNHFKEKISDVNNVKITCAPTKATLEQNALTALHLVRCQEFTAYDPKKQGYVCTRFCSCNIALFDLDEECEHIHNRSVLIYHV